MTIPSDILAAEAAGRIPSDVSLQYLAQSRDHSAIVGILFLVCLTGSLLIVRLYARFYIVKKVGFDDALAILTMMIYITFVVLSVVLIDLGSGRHIEYIQYVLSLATVRQTEVLDFVAHVLYTTALFFCRLSGLAFYFRLTARTGKLHVAILAAAPFLFAAYLPQLFLLIFHCRPVTGLWPYAWQSEPVDYKCLSWGLVYPVNSGLSLACDVMMFVIPAILIKQLHVSLEKKIKLSFVMFPGVLGQWASDGSWAYNPMLCVENAEIAGTMIALSVPALKPVFGNLFSHLTDYTSSHTRSRSVGRLRSHSKPVSGMGSHTRDDNRLLKWSKLGHDDYEMMPSEVSVTRDANGSIISSRPGIKVTNEVNVTRMDGRTPSPEQSSRPSSQHT
ncbi:uncharacterized protein N7477_003445 [Penicillium maclennaniae]|uniref:uncharacterized protein n=1 Tax=Penicillium maclennaniae TaxID=1343394 RepID=UPI0025410A4E|nr:uncharacterized protein N7477_003445 [Penicillium maclennaniae]KAJ5677812.1 hypothetical protein N7477_003445 [Penicillium maclennaniae]